MVSPGWNVLLTEADIDEAGADVTVMVYVAVLVTLFSVYVTVTVFVPAVDILGEETLVGVTVTDVESL